MDPLNTSLSENQKEDTVEIEIPFPLIHYLSTEKCNLHNICRICLSIDEHTQCPLFLEKENVIIKMLTAITNMQIREGDGLPSSVCEICQKEIINCYEFRNKCIKSDYTLRSVLKGEFDAKGEILERNNTTDIECLANIKQNGCEIKEEINNEEDQYGTEDLKFLQDIKNMSDDEALCIVGETKNKEKKITIIKSDDTNELVGNILKHSERKSRKFKDILCSYCPKKFHQLKNLRSHVRKHHPECDHPFPCTKCKHTFTSEFDLRLHLLLHTAGPKWTCSECKKEFMDKAAFRRHLKRHMQSKRFRCEVCAKSFVELYALRRHARVHTGEKIVKKLACKYCDKRYASRSALTAHESQHSGCRPAVCTVCGKAFPNARLLASHRRVHSAEKPHVCHHCGKGFRHESTRNTHLRTHTGERPFECARCGKTFIQRSNLTTHMRTHTGERPFSCKHCDRKFASRSTLISHERTHTGERPFTCKICGKSYARINMKLHMRKHTGERPHACAVCPKQFVTAAHLKEHQRVHTGEKPFECAMCSKNFSSKSHLTKHVRAHEKKKGRGIFMYMPVKVSNKSLKSNNPSQSKIVKKNPVIKPASDCITEYLIVKETPTVPNICTVEETTPMQGLVCQDNSKELIVLGTEQNFITNGIAYVNDLNCTNNLELVTVNQGNLTAGNSLVEGTTVKVYQYDQSLLQIHSGAAHVTISRISSKMATNF